MYWNAGGQAWAAGTNALATLLDGTPPNVVAGRLVVLRPGTGSGLVTSSPAGIDCGATCSANFSDEQTVVLTASADPGSTFTGWSGEGCSGTGVCTVTMSAARTVTATFMARPFNVTTTSFPSGGTIPVKFVTDWLSQCAATGTQNVSPALAWANAPLGTQSYAIVVDDPDANHWAHWVLFNIPGTVTSLAEGATVGTAGSNDFGNARYDGPCPPTGTHRYDFTVYALSTPSINIEAGSSRRAAQAAFWPYVLGSAKVTGTYR
jgi:Raf kinase inhibitor-like YbhB/YbcL family protein